MQSTTVVLGYIPLKGRIFDSDKRSCNGNCAAVCGRVSNKLGIRNQHLGPANVIRHPDCAAMRHTRCPIGDKLGANDCSCATSNVQGGTLIALEEAVNNADLTISSDCWCDCTADKLKPLEDNGRCTSHDCEDRRWRGGLSLKDSVVASDDNLTCQGEIVERHMWHDARRHSSKAASGSGVAMYSTKCKAATRKVDFNHLTSKGRIFQLIKGIRHTDAAV